ncbi:MAG TPA: hypothetical protein VI072_11930 [Polyangiaceae bacterium]
MRNIYRTLTNALVFGAALSAIVAAAPDASADPRTHDGFYLHLNAGLGYLSTTAELAGNEATYSGVSLPSALMLGGTVGPVAIGGGLFGDYAFSPSGESDGMSSDLGDVSMTLVGIGVFADYYVDPHGGLHFQPFVGWGGLEFSVDGDSGGSDPTGLVLALGAGYDWWVADEWSIGVMGRIAYAPLSLNDVSFTTIAPAVLATFTYH